MINLTESIQKNLGFASLNKIDPNTQDINTNEKTFGPNSLAQAAIPAVLSGLFNYILQPHAEELSLSNEAEKGKWLPKIFGNNENEITDRIANYAGTSVVNAKGEMEHIADEAVRLVQDNLVNKNDSLELRNFAIEHKNDALPYLPAVLQTGYLLGNNNLDDRTHKMEGPISSLMHSFEKSFSSDNNK
jgi:hypothetical protein